MAKLYVFSRSLLLVYIEYYIGVNANMREEETLASITVPEVN